MTDAVLETHEVSERFPGVLALNRVSMSVSRLARWLRDQPDR
jgi:hypothetical protein